MKEATGLSTNRARHLQGLSATHKGATMAATSPKDKVGPTQRVCHAVYQLPAVPAVWAYRKK